MCVLFLALIERCECTRYAFVVRQSTLSAKMRSDVTESAVNVTLLPTTEKVFDKIVASRVVAVREVGGSNAGEAVIRWRSRKSGRFPRDGSRSSLRDQRGRG